VQKKSKGRGSGGRKLFGPLKNSAMKEQLSLIIKALLVSSQNRECPLTPPVTVRLSHIDFDIVIIEKVQVTEKGELIIITQVDRGDGQPKEDFTKIDADNIRHQGIIATLYKKVFQNNKMREAI
jgi:hypothetical protein